MLVVSGVSVTSQYSPIVFFSRSKPIPVSFHVLPDFALIANALLGLPTLRSLRVETWRDFCLGSGREKTSWFGHITCTYFYSNKHVVIQVYYLTRVSESLKWVRELLQWTCNPHPRCHPADVYCEKCYDNGEWIHRACPRHTTIS